MLGRLNPGPIREWQRRIHAAQASESGMRAHRIHGRAKSRFRTHQVLPSIRRAHRHQSTMTLASLQHLLRSASSLAEDRRFFVLGSASLLASFPETGQCSGGRQSVSTCLQHHRVRGSVPEQRHSCRGEYEEENEPDGTDPHTHSHSQSRNTIEADGRSEVRKTFIQRSTPNISHRGPPADA